MGIYIVVVKMVEEGGILLHALHGLHGRIFCDFTMKFMKFMKFRGSAVGQEKEPVKLFFFMPVPPCGGILHGKNPPGSDSAIHPWQIVRGI